MTWSKKKRKKKRIRIVNAFGLIQEHPNMFWALIKRETETERETDRERQTERQADRDRRVTANSAVTKAWRQSKIALKKRTFSKKISCETHRRDPNTNLE